MKKQQRDEAARELTVLEDKIKNAEGLVKQKIIKKAVDLRETKRICEMYVGKA